MLYEVITDIATILPSVSMSDSKADIYVSDKNTVFAYKATMANTGRTFSSGWTSAYIIYTVDKGRKISIIQSENRTNSFMEYVTSPGATSIVTFNVNIDRKVEKPEGGSSYNFV